MAVATRSSVSRDSSVSAPVCNTVDIIHCIMLQVLLVLHTALPTTEFVQL